MAYKLVIFDFDGTLADSMAWVVSVLHEVAVRYRFRVLSREEIEMLRGKDTRTIVRYLGVSFWKVPLIANHMRELAARDATKVRLFPGTHELLERLSRQGIVLAIVSSNSEPNIRRILGPESAARIRYYECGASIFGKAAKFRRVLARSKVAREHALSVADETRDIEAARRVGVASGAVTWGYATADILRSYQPTWMFETMEDILAACSRGPAGVGPAGP